MTMDEQTHRRRRRHAVTTQTQADVPPREESQAQSVAPEENAHEQQAPQTQSPHAALSRRRRREEKKAPPVDSEVFWHPESERVDEQTDAAPEKKTPFSALLAIDAAVCKIGDSLLYAIKWIGVGVMFLLNYVVLGLKKAWTGAAALLRTIRAGKGTGAEHARKRSYRRKADKQMQEQAAQASAPAQDSQRLSQTRTGKEKKRVVRAPGRKVSVGYAAAMAVLICLALVSAFMVTSILWRSISTKRLNSALSARHSQLEAQAQQSGAAEQEADETAAPEEFILETPHPAISAQPTMIPPEMLIAPDEPETTPVLTVTPKPEQAVKRTKFHQVGGDALPEMEALYQENRDLIGWLRMEGILDLPVVYRDNEYYLTRDFYKNKSASGTLFLDENHPFRENAQNLLLHGHNMKDGTMFGRLVQYETNLQFLKNNPFIQYSTLWKKEQYVIFAVLKVSLDVNSPNFFNYYMYPTFGSDEQFERYVRALQNRSVFSIPVSVQPSDALLTLSTCLNEDRLVIVARRLRDGESKSDLRHQVQLAAKQ